MVHQEKAREELRLGLDGAHGGAVARLTDDRPSPATARHGEERTRFARARRCSRARKEGERWSGEGVPMGAELSGELGRAPANNSGRLEPYHIERSRAQAARCGGGAAGEMEMAQAHWSSRNGQLQRWRVAEVSAAAAAYAGGGERAKWRSEEERIAVGQM